MCEYTPHSPSLAPREVLTISGIQGGAHRVGLAISSEWLPEVQASVVCSHLESAYQIRGCTQGWETTANGFISPLHPSKEKLSTPHFPSLKAHSLRATAGRAVLAVLPHPLQSDSEQTICSRTLEANGFVSSWCLPSSTSPVSLKLLRLALWDRLP